MHRIQSDMKQNKYTEQELLQLHDTLYEILGEIIRVCKILKIPFFMIGGSAIGCYYWDAIVPYDDDIDIGMKREDYNKFLESAPKMLKEKYFLQWMGTEPHMPYYFAKVRKNGTMYVEELTENINMHQGAFVDVIPFDRIPNSPWLQKVQRKMANLLGNSFVSKEIWQWRYFGKCDFDIPKPHSWLNCLVDRFAKLFIPKQWIYAALIKVQTFFNHSDTIYYNNVMIEKDYIKAESLEHLGEAKFGNFLVNVPGDLESYLRHHYPTLKKYLTNEELEQYSHCPKVLSL